MMNPSDSILFEKHMATTTINQKATLDKANKPNSFSGSASISEEKIQDFRKFERPLPYMEGFKTPTPKHEPKRQFEKDPKFANDIK